MYRRRRMLRIFDTMAKIEIEKYPRINKLTVILFMHGCKLDSLKINYVKFLQEKFTFHKI